MTNCRQQAPLSAAVAVRTAFLRAGNRPFAGRTADRLGVISGLAISIGSGGAAHPAAWTAVIAHPSWHRRMSFKPLSMIEI
jgi:hypothetical protein